MKPAMILAAGRGERLKPFTNTTPKALCQIYQVPIIEYHMQRLKLAKFERVIINHAYLGDQIRHYLLKHHATDFELLFSPEPPGGLETGGGIVNALPLLGQQPFITINADVYTDFELKHFHLPQGSEAHLLLAPKPAHRPHPDFGLSPNHYLKNDDKVYTYAGIAYYHPKIFEACKPGRYSITPILRQLATQQKITGEVHAGIWFDIGSPQQLKLAEEAATV